MNVEDGYLNRRSSDAGIRCVEQLDMKSGIVLLIPDLTDYGNQDGLFCILRFKLNETL